jgi:hypothetical protein
MKCEAQGAARPDGIARICNEAKNAHRLNAPAARDLFNVALTQNPKRKKHS